MFVFIIYALQESGNVRVGDQVLKVQGESVKGMDFDEVGARL